METKREFLTCEDLKSNSYGTHCGIEGKEKSLSQELVIEFIEKYFSEKLKNIEIWDDEILSAEAEFSNIDISEEELKSYLDFFNTNDEVRSYIICEAFKFKETEDLIKNISNIDKKSLICEIFESLVGFYGGSIKIEIIDNLIKIVSE